MRKGMVSQTARPQYYDRNALVKTGYYNSGAVAPHAETIRATYTVSAGKKGFIEVVSVRTKRLSAAAPVGEYGWTFYYTPNGGGLQALLISASFDNTVNAVTSAIISQFGAMVAGDTIDFRTVDGSTGGTVGYLGQFKGAEFDA